MTITAMSTKRELEGDLKEFHSLFKDFIHLKYERKCNELKEKEELLHKTETCLKIAKEEERSIKYHTNQLQENLNKYREIINQNILLEGEINKLLKAKKDLETCLLTERELHNSEKDNWQDEKTTMRDNFISEIEQLKRKNIEEVTYMKDSLNMDIRELERKTSNVEDELAFTRLNNEEVLKQSKKVYEEKIRKKDKEITALKEELNYWRQRNFYYPSTNKVKYVGERKDTMQQRNKKQVLKANLKGPGERANNTKTVICFQDNTYRQSNRGNPIEISHEMDQQEAVNRDDETTDLTRAEQQINDHSNKHVSNDEMIKTNSYLEPEKTTQVEIEQEHETRVRNKNIQGLDTSKEIDNNNATSLIDTNNKFDSHLEGEKSNLSPEEFSNYSQTNFRPKALVTPMNKKTFPVIKKKRLLNSAQDFFL